MSKTSKALEVGKLLDSGFPKSPWGNIYLVSKGYIHTANWGDNYCYLPFYFKNLKHLLTKGLCEFHDPASPAYFHQLLARQYWIFEPSIDRISSAKMGHPPKRVRSVGAFKTTPLIGAIKEKQKPANPFIRPFIGVRSLLISSTVPLCWDFLWFPLFFMDVFVSTASTVLNLTFCFQCIYLINIAFSFICLFPGEFASVDILSVCAGQACLAKKKQWHTHTHTTCVCYFATIAISMTSCSAPLPRLIFQQVQWLHGEVWQRKKKSSRFPDAWSHSKSFQTKDINKKVHPSLTANVSEKWLLFVERRSFSFGSWGELFFRNKQRSIYIPRLPNTIHKKRCHDVGSPKAYRIQTKKKNVKTWGGIRLEA